MSTRTESIEAVRARLLDPGRSSGGTKTLELNDLGRAIDAAVKRYSKDRPRHFVASITGAGTRYYAVSSNLSSWVRGSSVVEKVNYPADTISEDENPQWLDDRDYEIYLDATDTEYLYFPVHEPSATETIRCHYTAPHTHTDATDTIFANDLEAMRDLAAGIACEMLATRASGSTDSTIGADSVNYRDKQMRYRQEADAWTARYREQMGLPKDGSPAASAVVWEWQSERAERQSWLLH